MSETVSHFDVAVIGGGPGGYVAALRAADRGANVALIEAHLAGGTCLNVGCIPTKALLHASEIFHQVSGPGAADLGIHADGLRFELADLIDAKDRIVERLRKGLETVIGQRKSITRLAGVGRIAGPGRVEVRSPEATAEIAAASIIIATGSEPIRPKLFEPFDAERVMTTDEVLSLRRQPGRLLIVGGGVNGCEQATFFAEIGTRVTVVEALERILPTHDEDVSREVAKGLKKRKATLLPGRRVESLGREGDGLRAVLDDGATVEADAVLVVVGRRPRTDGLGLENVGLSTDEHGYLRVDDGCRTSAAGIFAAGDVTGGWALAHVAYRQGEVAAVNATGGKDAEELRIVPAGIFTHPEVATVGLSESAAAAGGGAVRVTRFPLQALGIAQAQQLASGWVKLIASADGQRILGAAAVCPRAVEVIHEVALAMRHNLPIEALAETIHAHPTYSEAIKEAADHFLGFPIHGLKG